MSHKLLIVDDELANIRLLNRLFQHDYECLTASTGTDAITLLDQHEVAVIISDQRMPQMTGIELLKRSAARRPHMVRILLTGYTDLEALIEAVNCGLVYMYISKPWNNDDIKLRVNRAVELYENNKRQHLLAANNERLTTQLREMKLGFVRAISSLLRVTDPYLSLHAVRVSKCAHLIGEKVDLSEQSLWDMRAASFFHDLGAIGRADEMYSLFAPKGNQVSPEQYVARAAEVISCLGELGEITDIVRYHYENFDGSGKPLGLIGDQIPLAARILRVTKEFDLLTNPRAEEQAVSPEVAMSRLQGGSGIEFDPLVVQTLGSIAQEMRELVPPDFKEMPLQPAVSYQTN